MYKNMGRKPKDEEGEVTINPELSKNLLGSLLNGYKDDHYDFVKSQNKIISTGSLLLDSLVKVRTGSVIRLVGKGAELGKTSECFVLAKNFMDVMPKSKTLFIKAESRLGPEMQQRSGHKFAFTAEDWDYGTVYVLNCNIFETIAQILETLLNKMHEQGEYLCVILDSLDGCLLKSDKSKNIWGGSENVKVAGVPLMTKLLFKRLALPINHYDALMLVTGQYSAEIKLDPYSPNIPRQVDGSGGSSIGHQSDYVFSYNPRYNGDFILEDPDSKPDINKNKIIGVYSTVEIKKSGTDVTGSKVKIPIKKGRIGNAIWKEYEIADMLLAYSYITKAGAGWMTLDNNLVQELSQFGEIPAKIQGIPNLRKFLEDNPKITDYLYNKFVNALSN
jgi:hypothetical protein